MQSILFFRGFMVGSAVGVLVAYVLNLFVFDIFWTQVYAFIGASYVADTLVTTATAAIAAFIGGFIAGRVAHSSSPKLGLCVGIALIVISSLMSWSEWQDVWHLLTFAFVVQLLVMNIVSVVSAALGSHASRVK
ncbi:MAG: hypothetical protein AAB573_04160 [Patescibacteria group bacterium]